MKATVAALLACALGCASGPVRSPCASYHVPRELVGFGLARLGDAADPAAGFSASYAGPHSDQRIELFVSSALNLPFETSSADALWTHAQATSRALESDAARSGSRLALASDEVSRFRTQQGLLDGVIASYRGENASGAPIYALTYVTILGTDFVVARATATGSEASQAEGVLRVGCETLLRELRPRAALPKTRDFAFFSSRPIAPRISDGRLSCGAQFELDYAMNIAGQLAGGAYLHTPERELAAREWAIAVARPECDGEAFSDLEAIHRAGFGRELLWSQPAPYWREPRGLQMAEFVRARLGGRELLERIPVRVRFKACGKREGGAPIRVFPRPR